LNKYYLIFLIFLFISRDSIVIPNVLKTDFPSITKYLNQSPAPQKINSSSASFKDEEFSRIISDFENRIPLEFKIKPYFESNILFWFKIYSLYSSTELVIHDSQNLDLVYSVIDFSPLTQSQLSYFGRHNLIESITKDKITEIKNSIEALAFKAPKSSIEKALFDSLKNHFPIIPSSRTERIRFFKTRAQSVRGQTGQRDKILQGTIFYEPFSEFIENLFSIAGEPIELRSIPFLESSFNIKAESKVGALGVWQFMPIIANAFLPKLNPHLDYRLSPMITAVAAVHLLQQNKKILKSWDLAITAYNSGTLHLLKASRKLQDVEKIDLETILKSYKHPHLGFASKNFYSEFIALVYTLAYKDLIYKSSSLDTFPQLDIFISLCSFNVDKIDKSYPGFKNLNPQFRDQKKSYPRGSLVVFENNKLGKMFLKIDRKKMIQVKPKDWIRFTKNYNCSTK
jgi:membrane-bound lytic murein transglycosylase D